MSEVLMYGVELESRCMVNVCGSDETVAFLVGTQNMKLTNEICHVHLDGSRIVAKSRQHPIGEVRALACDPNDEERFITGSSDYGKTIPSHSYNLFRMKKDDEKLELMYSMSIDSEVKSLEFHNEGMKVASIHNNHVNICDIEKPFEWTWNHKVEGSSSVAIWSPHSYANIIGVPIGYDIVTFDLRTKSEGNRINNAHSLRCLYLDFNPNIQNVVVSSGRDGLLKIWDWRNSSYPLISFRSHAHWATQVHFHPVHDELILSSGSDGSLLLTSAYTVSSDSKEHDDECEDRVVLADGLLERIDEHEDSIYACAWSTADPWTFASLSFDGRILISHVNREHKYALMKL